MSATIRDLSGKPGTYLACADPDEEGCMFDRWSSTPGDYFMLSPSDPLPPCPHCGGPSAVYRDVTYREILLP